MLNVATPNAEALKLLQDEWADQNNMLRFPVDVDQLAARLGIEVQRVVLPSDTAGFIIKESPDAKARVFLNASDIPTRQRFTLAHELGHYAKRRGDVMGFVDKRNELASSGVDPHEIWANAFAAELLMPAHVVNAWWALGASADDMRRQFDVSSAAMNVRLSSLGLA